MSEDDENGEDQSEDESDAVYGDEEDLFWGHKNEIYYYVILRNNRVHFGAFCVQVMWCFCAALCSFCENPKI